MKEKYSNDALKKKLEQLPVPDEEQSWQKMKALLDKDEKKRRILPPFFLNCAGWALLILLTAGGIFIFRPFSKDNSISKTDPIETTNVQTDKTSQMQGAKTSSERGAYDSGRSDTFLPVPIKNKDDQNLSTKRIHKEGNKRRGFYAPMSARLKKTKEQGSQPIAGSSINKGLAQSITNTTSENIVVKKDAVAIPGNEGVKQTGDSISQDNIVVKNYPPDSPVNENGAPGINDSTSDNNIVAKKEIDQVIDSTTFPKTVTDSLPSEKSLAPKKQKAPDFYLTPGLSFQQQMPLSGQSLNSYSVSGTKSAIADYLPAVFLRIYKQNKWFFQAGFRYSSPQATKKVAYHSTTTRNSVRRTTTTSTLRLQKTFYHQAPFSFHYLLLPGFSLGAGAMYSRFETAVSENEIKVRHDPTGRETVTKIISSVPSGTDPVFSSSQWHYLLQAEYSLKKWGWGLRYTGGFRPFMQYMENGIMKKEKHNSLQVLLRYDFVKRD